MLETLCRLTVTMLRSSILYVVSASLLCLVGSAASAQSVTGSPGVVAATPGLVAFWDFAEEAGKPRESKAPGEKHPLIEVGGTIPRVEGGPFSGYAIELDGQHYLHIPHAELRDLDIHGAKAQVSIPVPDNIRYCWAWAPRLAASPRTFPRRAGSLGAPTGAGSRGVWIMR